MKKLDDKFLVGLQQMIVDGVVAGTVEGITAEFKKAIQDVGTSYINKPYMNKGEVCKYLGISRPTLDRWISKGLPVNLVDGQMYFIDVNDVVDYIKEHSM